MVKRVLVVSLLLFGLQAIAMEPLTPPKMPRAQLRWVDGFGKLVNIGWKAREGWKWAKLFENDPYERPVLQIKFDIPAGIAIRSHSVSNGRAYFAVNQDANQPNPVFVVETASPNSMVKLELEDSVKQTKKEVSLLIELNNSHPAVWRHISCVEQDVRIVMKAQNNVNHLYAGIFCEMKDGRLRLTFISSEDVMIKGAMIQGAEPVGGAGKLSTDTYWQSYDVPMKFLGKVEWVPKKEDGKPNQSGQQAQATQANQAALYHVGRYVAVKSNLTSFVSLGASYLAYTEDPQDISLTELGITGKGQVNYWLLPQKLDSSASAYITLLPLFAKTSGGAGISATRFYGINFRLGYLIGDFPLKISGGWYIWGMLGVKGSYGISYVMGPQILLSTQGVFPGTAKPCGGYLKFAPISDKTLSFSFSSREIAAGGNISLSPIGSAHAWGLSLDLAHTDIRATHTTNRLRLLSLSLGLSYGL